MVKALIPDLNVNILKDGDLSIELEGPEMGWLNITLNIKGKEPFVIEVSDAYNPFPAIKSWMEDMMEYKTFPSKSVAIDCERYNVLLSYDYTGNVGVFGEEDCVLIKVVCDIEEDREKNNNEGMTQFVVPIYSFVSLFYNTLKNYCYNNRRTFWRNWRMPNSDSFEFRTFIQSIESKKIEERIDCLILK